MKSKEYAKQVLSNLTDITDTQNVKNILGKLGIDFLKDFETISKARNIGIKSFEISLVNLIKEFSDKWKRTVLIINTETKAKYGVDVLKYNGFIELFKELGPEAKELVNRYHIQ